MHAISLKPADFFDRNPAIDVPSQQNLASQLYENTPAMIANKIAAENCCLKDFPTKKNVVVVVTTATSASGATSVTTTATRNL